MARGGPTVSSDSVAQDQLRAFVERIERMEEEKKAISDDIKEIYAEAKGNGFDTKVLRQVIRIRKQDRAERLEQEALLELYLAALGMADAPAEDDDELISAAEQFAETMANAGGGSLELPDGSVVEFPAKDGRKRRHARPADLGFELGGDLQ